QPDWPSRRCPRRRACVRDESRRPCYSVSQGCPACRRYGWISLGGGAETGDSRSGAQALARLSDPWSARRWFLVFGSWSVPLSTQSSAKHQDQGQRAKDGLGIKSQGEVRLHRNENVGANSRSSAVR